VPKGREITFLTSPPADQAAWARLPSTWQGTAADRTALVSDRGIVSGREPTHHERMWQLPERVAIELDLVTARRRAEADVPSSPAWDAAMAWVEDLERALRRLDHANPSPGRP